ncbi:MAG: hypothetical protein IKP76_01125 [Bacilli bacterium]|nr:hypothetical protein [Bacilli bacterium]
MNDNNWYKLDNVAFLFATLRNRKRPNVFRFSCELTDVVDKDWLKIALKETVQTYPNFHVNLKSGLFWYYYQSSSKDVYVVKEDKPICHKLVYDENDLLYEVSYHGNRINLEMSHILSDGRGALKFFKLLVNNYIKYRYNEEFRLDVSSSELDHIEDSYDKYYQPTDTPKNSYKNIYRYKVPKLGDKTRFYEVHCDLNKIIEIAHRYNTTLTTYLLAVFIYSTLKEYKVSDYNKLIKIELPVDLRSFYESESLKNFFGIVYIDFRPSKGNLNFEDIIKVVSEQMASRINSGNLESRTNMYVKFQKLITARIVPLFIKKLVVSNITRILSGKRTTCFSNVGTVIFDENVEKYIKCISLLSSTDDFQFTLISNKNDLCIGISSIYKYNNIVRNFVKLLRDEGVEIYINTEVV